MSHALSRADDERINWVSSTPFLLCHLVPFAAFFTGVSRTAVVLAVSLYCVRMFAITGGYHRYFSHRTYRVNRVFQFVLGFVGTMSVQQGPLWWAAHHRMHHRYSDTEQDIHSPQKGFWWSHVGWILSDKYDSTDLDAVKDLAVYPELRFINRWDKIGPVMLAVFTYVVGGWSGLVIGFFLSTVVLWHATFTINSLSHTFGTRRYATSDTSRNNPLLALLTFGEGWHNNHHHYQASARQGFFWWEFDLSWYALRLLGAIGLVRDLRQPTEEALAGGRVRDGAFDIGMFKAAWRRAGAAVTRSHPALGSQVAAATEALAARQVSLEAAITSKRAALEEAVAASLHAAEELRRTTARAARGITSSTPDLA